MTIYIIFPTKLTVFRARQPPEPSLELFFFDFLVVFDDFSTVKPRTLEKTQVCQGYRPRNGYFYRSLRNGKEVPSSSSSPAECEARLLDFFVVFDDFLT
jgi:hypothetical protein